MTPKVGLKLEIQWALSVRYSGSYIRNTVGPKREITTQMPQIQLTYSSVHVLYCCTVVLRASQFHFRHLSAFFGQTIADKQDEKK